MDYVCDFGMRKWQLYEMEGVEAVARSLSKSLTTMVREAKQRLKAEPLLSEIKLARHIQREMFKLMVKQTKFGATDSEPMSALLAELERAFGLETYSLAEW